jgi:hypothetical protein
MTVSKPYSVGQQVDAMTDTVKTAVGDAVDRGQAAVDKLQATWPSRPHNKSRRSPQNSKG